MRATVLRGACVRTMNTLSPEAEAVAFRGGQITSVGRADDVLSEAGKGAEVIDLPRKFVLPGFHDSHLHLMQHGLELRQIDLNNVPDMEAALGAVQRSSEGLPEGAWIQGSGFSLTRWGVTDLSRLDLDEAAPRNPVLLRSQDHHSAWVNTAALKRAGVLEHRPDPPDGRFLRDRAGRATGLILERALDLIKQVLPSLSLSELVEVAQIAGRDLASYGITTVHHMAYEPVTHWRALATAASDPAYPVRVWSCIPQQEIEMAAAIGIATGQGGDNFCIGGAKFFADGALGSETAWMLEPYAGTSNCGLVIDGPKVLAARYPLALEAGLIPVTHAIGDAAGRAVLEALEATRELWPEQDPQPRVEHAQHLHADDVERLGALGLTASIQPIHLTFDLMAITASLPDRLDRAYATRSLKSAGALLAFGSDTPVARPDLVRGIRAAVERRDSLGQVLTPQQALTPREALEAYTVGAARAIGRQDRSGQIRPGYHADFTLFDADPLQPSENLSVVGTIKGGRWTFRSGWERGG